MIERDTRQDLMIIQDNKHVAFAKMTHYEETSEQFEAHLKATHGIILTGKHSTVILRPYNSETDSISKGDS